MSREADAERGIVPYQSVVSPVIAEAQFEALYGKTPPHSIKTRPGKGGKVFRYVPHGYVTDRLNKAFGFDWDFTLQPVFDGSIFHLEKMEEDVYSPNGRSTSRTVNHLAIYGELKVRLRNPSDMTQVLSEVTKAGPGSQIWQPTMEFGDALKGAKSDGLKVAAHKLGIGLDLYYDDQYELDLHREKQEAAAAVVESMREEEAASTLPAFLASAQSQLGMDADRVIDVLGITMEKLIETFPVDGKEMWKHLSNPS
jgi:hypothetical protein